MTKRVLTLAIVAVMTAVTAMAQVNKAKWTNRAWTTGSEEIYAYPIDAQHVFLAAKGFYDAGYGYAFKVKQGANGSYLLTPVSESAITLPKDLEYNMAVDPSDINGTWTRQSVQGVDVIVVKNGQGSVTDVYAPLDPGQEMTARAVQIQTTLLCGSHFEGYARYTDKKGKDYIFYPDGKCFFDDKKLTYEIGFDEAMPVSVIKLSNGASYFFELTVEGINLYNAKYDNDTAMYEKKGLYASCEFDRSEPRFGYLADMVICNANIAGLDRKVLRIMRNEIWARHGYKFNDAGLAQYFSSCPWYKAGINNNKITLSPIEELNVRLIKGMEDRK